MNRLCPIAVTIAAAGATFDDVVKLNFYILDAGQLSVLREVRDHYVNTKSPPASMLVEVRRLFRRPARGGGRRRRKATRLTSRHGSEETVVAAGNRDQRCTDAG